MALVNQTEFRRADNGKKIRLVADKKAVFDKYWAPDMNSTSMATNLYHNHLSFQDIPTTDKLVN